MLCETANGMKTKENSFENLFTRGIRSNFQIREAAFT
jgi:hypothetical protein